MPEQRSTESRAAASAAVQDAKHKVNTRFSQTAAGYRVSQVHARGAEFAQLLAIAGFQGTETIVDAGCGAGHTAAHIAPHVAHVIAVDLSTEMLAQAAEVCREKGLDNVSFVQGDVETLDVVVAAHNAEQGSQAHIDAVVSRFSAHHWPDPSAALAAIQRLLAPTQGRMYLVDVVSQDEFVYDTHLQAIELLRDPSHIRDHSVAQWEAMFEQAGFAARPIFIWDLAIDFADWVARMQTPDLETQAIRNLFDGAPDEVRARFNLAPGCYDFTFYCALLEAHLQSTPHG